MLSSKAKSLCEQSQKPVAFDWRLSLHFLLDISFSQAFARLWAAEFRSCPLTQPTRDKHAVHVIERC